jgi:hypothetical protein
MACEVELASIPLLFATLTFRFAQYETGGLSDCDGLVKSLLIPGPELWEFCVGAHGRHLN